MLARTPALAPVVHRAFADGLDLAYAVAAGLGFIAAVAVFTLVRPKPQAAAPPPGHPRQRLSPQPESAPASAEA